MKNVLVAQSGGPSPVINASLQGVIDACGSYPGKTRCIYAGWHGIEGVLLEELIEISSQDPDEIALLKYTPAAGAIGTCGINSIVKNSGGFRQDSGRHPCP